MKKKTADDYQKINVITELNKVIKRNINLSSSVNVFSEKFVEMHCIFLINIFSEYD